MPESGGPVESDIVLIEAIDLFHDAGRKGALLRIEDVLPLPIEQPDRRIVRGVRIVLSSPTSRP